MNEGQAEEQWLDPDELEVVRALRSTGVRFLVVGGRAVQFHGHLRPAKDLDLLVDPSAENWPSLQVALRPLNAGVPALEELSPERKYRARLRFYETVELLTAVEGVCFMDAWTESIATVFAGLEVRVISKAHLILSKKHRQRRVDVDDITALTGISKPETTKTIIL